MIPKAAEIISKQKELLRSEGIQSEWVFPWVDGRNTSIDNLEKAWRRYVKYNNLPSISLYEMSRHTFISINKQMPVELLKMVAGHGSTMDTTKVYGHEVNGELDLAAELIEGKMNAIINIQERR